MTTQRWVIAIAIAVTAPLLALTIQGMKKRSAKAAAERQETRVREVLDDEPLAGVSIPPAHDLFTSLLYQFGVTGPRRRRGEENLMRINPADPIKGPTRTAGQTIDACRGLPESLPAKLFLKRKVFVSDPHTRFGPYSSRSWGAIGGIKGLEVYTYGDLDVGIKDGALVAVQVR